MDLRVSLSFWSKNRENPFKVPFMILFDFPVDLENPIGIHFPSAELGKYKAMALRVRRLGRLIIAGKSFTLEFITAKPRTLFPTVELDLAEKPHLFIFS